MKSLRDLKGHIEIQNLCTLSILTTTRSCMSNFGTQVFAYNKSGKFSLKSNRFLLMACHYDFNVIVKLINITVTYTCRGHMLKNWTVLEVYNSRARLT